MPRSVTARPASKTFQPISAVLRLRQPFAIAMVVFAVLGVLANLSGLDATFHPHVGGAATHPVTAICLAGLAVCILRTKRYGASAVWRAGVLACILVICAARLMGVVLSGVSHVVSGGLFGPIAGFGGHFSIEAAVVLGAFATAVLLRHTNGRWGSVLLVLGLAVVCNTLLGLSVGITFLNGNVSVFTLLGMGCAAVAMVSVYVHRPVVRAGFLLGDVGSQTRVMAAAVFVIPWTAAVVLDNFRGAGGVSPFEAGVVSGIIWVMLILLLTTSARHEGSVAARRRAEREIALQSRTDALTGALNQFGVSERIEKAWLTFKSGGGAFGMILVDLNYFRRLDATFGQDDGEAVLERIAATLQLLLRTSDALGRWGADEFLVLLKIKDHSDIAIVADRLRGALADVENPFCAGLTMVPATIDAVFGISELQDGDGAATDALIRADTDLHRVKTAHAMIREEQAAVGEAMTPMAEAEARYEPPSKAATAA